jgi:enamine deaminase RidA (YjgF/YER057c/UK114 family)
VSSGQTPKRRVLGIAGAEHHAPIPQAVEIGGFVYSSAVFGQDPATGELPDDPARQAALVFQHVRTLLEQAGGGPHAIAKMTIYVNDDAYRDDVNREWLSMFPDEDDRPARHIVRTDLRRGMLVQCEFVAVLRDCRDT